MPAVREKSVDQAKPMITSESDRMARRPTSQPTCSAARHPRQQIGEGQPDGDADHRDEAATGTARSRARSPKKAVRKRA